MLASDAGAQMQGYSMKLSDKQCHKYPDTKDP